MELLKPVLGGAGAEKVQRAEGHQAGQPGLGAVYGQGASEKILQGRLSEDAAGIAECWGNSFQEIDLDKTMGTGRAFMDWEQAMQKHILFIYGAA